jgi:hypothetical protein
MTSVFDELMQRHVAGVLNDIDDWRVRNFFLDAYTTIGNGIEELSRAPGSSRERAYQAAWRKCDGMLATSDGLLLYLVEHDAFDADEIMAQSANCIKAFALISYLRAFDFRIAPAEIPAIPPLLNLMFWMLSRLNSPADYGVAREDTINAVFAALDSSEEVVSPA